MKPADSSKEGRLRLNLIWGIVVSLVVVGLTCLTVYMYLKLSEVQYQAAELREQLLREVDERIAGLKSLGQESREKRETDWRDWTRSVKGEKGESGFPGRPGRDGEPGEPGEPGPSGPPGLVGRSDRPGSLYRSRGEPGLPGPQGIPGEKGESGFPGRPGMVGEPGTPGEPGRSGLSGLQGLDGLPGLDGIPGEHGYDGVKGEKGESGDSQLRVPRRYGGQKGDPGALRFNDRNDDNFVMEFKAVSQRVTHHTSDIQRLDIVMNELLKLHNVTIMNRQTPAGRVVNGSVRLGGRREADFINNYTAGELEIWLEGRWNKVCAEYRGREDYSIVGMIVCKGLGGSFTEAHRTADSIDYRQRIIYFPLCRGYEENLSECRYSLGYGYGCLGYGSLSIKCTSSPKYVVPRI